MSIERSVIKNVTNVIGVKLEDLEELWKLLTENSTKYSTLKGRLTFKKFLGILVCLRMGLSWDHTEEVNCAFGLGSYDEKTWRNAMKDLGTLISNCNMNGLRRGCQVRKRFLHVDSKMPNVTALADGSPIPTRVLGGKYIANSGNINDLNYSGKYGFMAWKIEMWSTCLGVPIAFRGPINGKCHDMKFLEDNSAPFPHWEHERFAVDSGYFGMNHAILPFKTGESDGELHIGFATDDCDGGIELVCMADEEEKRRQLSAKQYWNKIHSHVRARIERKFGHMLMWKWMRNTDLHAEAVENAMLVTIAVESFTGFKYPPEYPTWSPGNPRDFATGIVCNCEPGTPLYRQQYKLCLAERLPLAHSLFSEGFAPERRLPSKRGRVENEDDPEAPPEIPPHKLFTTLLEPSTNRRVSPMRSSNSAAVQ